MSIVRYLFIFLTFIAANSFFRFLGSGGIAIMITTKNLLLFSIFLLAVIFFFRYSFNLNRKPGFRLVFMISIFFLISLFGSFLRIFLLAHLNTCVNVALPFVILGVSGKEILLHSGTSSSSSWTEDSFEMRVLLEPFSETEMEGTSVNPTRVAADEAGPSHQSAFVPNSSLESSLRNRIVRLENERSIFLLDKEKGGYWNDIKGALDQAPSQREYNRLLEFENRDLQIRERKHSCYSLFQQVLSENPLLEENAPYDPREALVDFFDEKRGGLDTNPEWDGREKDRREIQFLTQLQKDLERHGPNSAYIKTILGG